LTAALCPAVLLVEDTGNHSSYTLKDPEWILASLRERAVATITETTVVIDKSTSIVVAPYVTADRDPAVATVGQSMVALQQLAPEMYRRKRRRMFYGSRSDFATLGYNWVDGIQRAANKNASRVFFAAYCPRAPGYNREVAAFFSAVQTLERKHVPAAWRKAGRPGDCRRFALHRARPCPGRPGGVLCRAVPGLCGCAPLRQRGAGHQRDHGV